MSRQPVGASHSFRPDWRLLRDAGKRLQNLPGIYWIVGGSAAGKSTVCRYMREEMGLTIYDMDAHFFGSYRSSYQAGRHPAAATWFSADDPLAWALSLDARSFDGLYRAANIECLDLFAADLERGVWSYPLVVDGGITHPSVLVQAVPACRIACLHVPAETSAAAWNHAPERVEMRRSILQLEYGETRWRRFLVADAQIAETLIRESRQEGIQVFARRDFVTVAGLARAVVEYLGLVPSRWSERDDADRTYGACGYTGSSRIGES